ncbi:MAG: glycine cleavage system protein GcvH [Candidatus Omnitrophica bacterium]|nr:glycine cleavage system protein GcvH [Candidatus Omnitrophota bacterium]
MIPDDLKYTREHEWVKIEGGEAVFGITDHAQEALGDITFVELPRKEDDVKQTDSIATIESVKAASDVYAPLSGKVIDINESLQESPEAINSSPYEEGWICRVSIADPEEEDNLMSAGEYKKYLDENQ